MVAPTLYVSSRPGQSWDTEIRPISDNPTNPKLYRRRLDTLVGSYFLRRKCICGARIEFDERDFATCTNCGLIFNDGIRPSFKTVTRSGGVTKRSRRAARRFSRKIKA
ncbi:MAG: hypothetical protein A4E47_00800 [Methanosaeta sp. PtaU1.Bin028]|nr:MAG: hypothetical protein A4E47_00800 [Methanosaeta sp. PtaU1.Bin028]